MGAVATGVIGARVCMGASSRVLAQPDAAKATAMKAAEIEAILVAFMVKFLQQLPCKSAQRVGRGPQQRMNLRLTL